MTRSTQEVMIIAGEPSGDWLGSLLAKALLNKNPDIRLTGMGGHLMKASGVNIVIDADKLAIIGIIEIFKHFNRILSIRKLLKAYFNTKKPDLIIFIDYPGFNLHMAKYAKRAGSKVLYYVSPQIWAWRYHRIHTIKKFVDRMAVLFSFEEKIYQKENIPVTFVGHPLVDKMTAVTKDPLPLACEKLNRNQKIIALFPGSRRQEITRLLPIMIGAVRIIQKKHPEVQWVLPLAPNLALADIQPFLIPEIKVIENQLPQILPLCDIAIAASGTVTLEIALKQIPLIIVYKVTLLSYWLGRWLLKIPYIGLCNIVAEKCVAKELIQHEATAHNIAKAIFPLLNQPELHQQSVADLGIVKEKLSHQNGAQTIDSVALAMLSKV